MDYTTFLKNNFPPQTDASMGDFKTIDEVENILLSNRIKLPKDGELTSHLSELYTKQMIGSRLYFLM